MGRISTARAAGRSSITTIGKAWFWGIHVSLIHIFTHGYRLAISVTTSLSRSSHTPLCPMESVPFFCTLVTACPTCLPQRRLTYCLPKRAKVSSVLPQRAVPNTDIGPDLVTFCERRGMPYTTFQNWSTILSTTKDILAGKVTPSEVAAQTKKA